MSNALQTLVAERRRFQSFIAGRVGDAEEAEDILQEALLRALKSPPADDDPEGTVRWFYRVLRNALIDRARSATSHGRALEQFAREPSSDTQDPLWDAVCECVGTLLVGLKQSQADILRAVDVENQPISDVAARLGITQGNARVRLHRARAELRTELESFCRTCAHHGCRDCTCRNRPQPKSETS